MAELASVDINTPTLEGLLEELRDGRIQVPEFQRQVKLDDDGVRLLLASVSLGYPIGVIKLLEAGHPDVRFDSRPIAGAPPASTHVERLLVDGQHRMTALYRVLASRQEVPTGGDHEEHADRWYYIDIKAALDPDTDRDEAILSAPDARGPVESEWEQHRFPLRLVFGAEAARRRWQRGFIEYGARADSGARTQLMERFEAEVLAAFAGYLLPTIIVDKEWTRWAVRVHGGREGRTLSDRFRVGDR